MRETVALGVNLGLVVWGLLMATDTGVRHPGWALGGGVMACYITYMAAVFRIVWPPGERWDDDR